MYRSFFRRLTTNVVNTFKQYPKLSFLGGILTATAFYCSVKHEENHPRTPLPPGLIISKYTHQPIIKLEKFLGTFQKDFELLEFKAKTPLYPDMERTYEGYDLLKILAAVGVNKAKNDLVIFEAKDGFKSYIPFALILKYRPMLAIRQQSAPPGQAWEVVDHPLNGKTDGGPYYLMWPGNIGRDVVDNHWAFGVTKITFGSFQKIFGELSPSSPDHKHGFKLFAQNCSCCHTFFNKGSANVGTPFERIPAKYLAFGSIAAYAANPPPNSAMPKQELTIEELKAIEGYVRFKTEEGPLVLLQPKTG